MWDVATPPNETFIYKVEHNTDFKVFIVLLLRLILSEEFVVHPLCKLDVACWNKGNSLVRCVYSRLLAHVCIVASMSACRTNKWLPYE